MDTVGAELREEAFVLSLHTDALSQYCGRCLQRKSDREANWPPCAGCRLFAYCSFECELADQPDHERECGRWQRVQRWRECGDTWLGWTDFLVAFMAEDWWQWPGALVRLVARLDDKLADPAARAFSSGGRSFDDLTDHVAQMEASAEAMEKFDQFLLLYARFVDIKPRQLDRERLMLLYSRVLTNAFPLTDDQLNEIGLSLHVGLSRVGHSCAPTARVMFRGREAVLLPTRAPRFDSPLDWQRVRISYVDDLATTAERRRRLGQLYFFDCRCKACLNTKRDVDMSCFVCADARCRGKAVPNAALGRVECVKCKKQMNDHALKERLDSAQFALRLMRRAIGDSGTPKDEKIEICQETIGQMAKLYYRYNVDFVRANLTAFNCCMELEKFSEAITFGRAVADAYRYYLGKLDAVSLVMGAKAARAYIRGGEREGAGELLFNAFGKYEHVYGKTGAAMADIGRMIMQAELS